MRTKIEAFKIKATVNGKSWETRGTTLTAENESAAREKAFRALELKPDHVIEVEPCEVYHIKEKLTTDSYPYGRERATAFFSVESNTKGMRTEFQTINPKNGRLNAVKKSTYYHVILPIKKEDQKIDFCGYLDFNGTENINKGLYFMEDFKELFTSDQIKQIALTILGMSKVNAKAMVIYAGAEWESLKQHFEQPIKNLTLIAKGESVNFLNCLFDTAKIEECKKPDFQPFKIVNYGI